MTTAIIIPTYNNEEYTLRCIDSIKRNTEDYIILWVDDGSSSESVVTVQKFLKQNSVPFELLAKDKNSGFAKSVNLGLTRALELNTEYIVIQNNDTEVYANWLPRMIDVAERETKIGAVGPVTSPCSSWQAVDNLRNEFKQLTNLPDYHNNPEKYAQQLSQLYQGEHLVTHKRLAFFSILLKADIVRKTGLISEEYGIGFGEDDDYMLRIRQKGYFGAIAKDVFVFHNHNTTFKSTYSKEVIQEMREHNRNLLFQKFQKGRFRPKNLDDLWDIEEAISYAKQLESRVQNNNELLERFKKQIQERNGWLKDKDKIIQDKKEVIQDKEETNQIKEKVIRNQNDCLKEKDKTIQIKNDILKRQKANLQSLKVNLQNSQDQLQHVRKDASLCNEELVRHTAQLDAVYNSTSWRVTSLLRKVGLLLKKNRIEI